MFEELQWARKLRLDPEDEFASRTCCRKRSPWDSQNDTWGISFPAILFGPLGKEYQLTKKESNGIREQL
jgi:hypothetical protein